MTIHIHSLLEKNPVTKKMLQPKFGYKFLGPYNDLDNQILYDKQSGDILKYYDKPKNILDKTASKHDTCYSVGKIKTIVIELWLKKLMTFHIHNDPGVHLLLNK